MTKHIGMVIKMTSSLEDLLVDEAEVAKDELAGALAPFVRFTRDGLLLLEPGFDGLSAANKVVCVLLACQAMKALNVRESASMTPAEIVEVSGMAAGTVRPKLSELLKSRVVAKEGSAYSLPLHSARRAVADLGGSA